MGEQLAAKGEGVEGGGAILGGGGQEAGDGVLCGWGEVGQNC